MTAPASPPSPCLTCWDDLERDCRTCLPRLAWEGATAPPDPPECLTCVDARHLLRAGVRPEDVASRLGMASRDRLATHMRRHGQRLTPQKEPAA